MTRHVGEHARLLRDALLGHVEREDDPRALVADAGARLGGDAALDLPIIADESWARLLIERGIDAEPGSSAGLEGPWIVLSLDVPEERLAEHAAVLAEVARHCPVRLVPSSNG